MTTVSTSKVMGPKIALTDAVDDRRLGGFAVKSFREGLLLRFDSLLKGVSNESDNSSWSTVVLLSSSGMDCMVGRALRASRGVLLELQEIGSPVVFDLILEEGLLIQLGDLLRDS